MIALWTAPQDGAWTRLPGPVTAWSILRTDRLGKDSFRVELADAALPDGRLRFSARVDGVGWLRALRTRCCARCSKAICRISAQPWSSWTCNASTMRCIAF